MYGRFSYLLSFLKWVHDRTYFPSFMIRNMTVFSIVNRGGKIPCPFEERVIIISNGRSSSYRRESHLVISKREGESFQNDSFAYDYSVKKSVINLFEIISKGEGLPCLICDYSVWIISKWKGAPQLIWDKSVSHFEMINHLSFRNEHHQSFRRERASIISKWQSVIISKRRARDNSGNDLWLIYEDYHFEMREPAINLSKIYN